MSTTTFKFDDKMEKTLDELQEYLNASSRAEVLRRAITLLRVVKESDEKNAGTVILREGDKEMQIILR